MADLKDLPPQRLLGEQKRCIATVVEVSRCVATPNVSRGHMHAYSVAASAVITVSFSTFVPRCLL